MKNCKYILSAIIPYILIFSLPLNAQQAADINNSLIAEPAINIARAWNNNDIDSIAPLLADRMVLHGPRPDGAAGFAGNRPGKAAFLIHLNQLKALLGENGSVIVRNSAASEDVISATYEFSGVHSSPYLGVGPTGQPITLTVQDTYRIENQTIVEAWHGPDRFSLIDAISSGPVNITEYKNITAEKVVTFPPGSFPESVVEHPNGDFYVTLQTDGQIWRVSEGEANLLVQLPEEALVGFLAGPSTLNVDADGRIIAVVMSANADFQGVWAFDAITAEAEKLAFIPTLNNHLNGSAIDSMGRIYIADSTLGIIWRVVEGDSQAHIWLRDPLIAPRQFVGLAPGANGLRLLENMFYIAVSDKQTMVKLPLKDDGSPGIASIHAEGLGGDDFAIDTDGTLFVTTHVGNSVVEIAPDGTILGEIATESDGIVGSTAAIVSYDSNGNKWLYVTNDGGLLGPPRPELIPNLSRILLTESER